MEIDREETIKGNILIAEYLGGEVDYVYKTDSFEQLAWKGPVALAYRTLFIGNNGEAILVEHLQFHASWDWIMPVVEKISQDYDISISSVGVWSCYISKKEVFDHDITLRSNYTPLITNVWLAIVDFLKWLNKPYDGKLNGQSFW